MAPLDFISAIIQYDPRVKKQQEEEQKRVKREPEQRATMSKKGTNTNKGSTTGNEGNKGGWEELTQQQKDDAAAKEAAAKKEAQERYQNEEREIAQIRVKVSKAEDVDSLRKLLSDLSPYMKNHELSARTLIREIESKIARISRTTIGSISTVVEVDIKSRILEDLSAGTLDVNQAIKDIEKVAQEACKSIAGDNERRAKLGVRITPMGYKSKILMDIIIGIETKHPIAEGREDEVIQQLVKLGANLQQATRAIVVNLIDKQKYQRAQELIKQYPQREQNAKKDKFDPEATRRVVENWNGMIITKQRESKQSDGTTQVTDRS